MADLRFSPEEFGADPDSLLLLDQDTPALLRYATLVTGRGDQDPHSVVDAVYEWQGAPLAYLVDKDSLEHPSQVNRIRRLLAMRGDAPYLAVIAPGSLEVYRIALDNKSPYQARVDWKRKQVAPTAVFPWLGNLRPDGVISSHNWISNVVLRLLTGSTTDLIHLDLSHEDAISLVGRALFTRFLADRGLLPEEMCTLSATARLFDTRSRAEETSQWLDDKFNGDLMPLSTGIFEILSSQGYLVLGNILRKAAPDGQLFLGWEEKWDNLDFAQIPVGVLSQAYELYLRAHRPDQQRYQGGFYTPTPIAELMVRASFRALKARGHAKSAKVLDPAVGGGVFLLTAFRQLVAEHWRADGRRPNTEDLRRILHDQLVGFDVDKAALRFAALGLYLLSIELDPDPRPVDKLRFDHLRGKVLWRLKQRGEDNGPQLGSLGPMVGPEHLGQYDLVIGNPPWTSRTGPTSWESVLQTVSRIAKNRQIGVSSPPLPNQCPDLPFVWRAMEWARPDGQIAFALHARLLFQQGAQMPIARQALFEALDVTSIINGAELRQTNVWPQISAPFCILFAKNRAAGAAAAFRFISPRIEKDLNDGGTMRVDALNAEIVRNGQLAETPDVLKTLFRGSTADLGILERIRMQGHPTLAALWRRRIKPEGRKRLRGSGSGYQTIKASSRIRRQGDGLPGADASYLHGLPEIAVGSFDSIFVNPEGLDIFLHERIHDPRSRELFVGPLLLVRQSPPAATGRIGVVISEEDVVFNERFYGYSPSGHPDAYLLVRYLALILGSRMAVWTALVTSGKFGVERNVIEKATLDRIAIPDFEKLTSGQRREIGGLVEGLDVGRVSWEDVDEWVMRLYGLGERDLQIIVDTLEFRLPYAKSVQSAQAPPTQGEMERFCEVLYRELNPWCQRFGSTLGVRQMALRPMAPWQAIEVRNLVGRSEDTERRASDWKELLNIADEAAASEVLWSGGSDSLLVARLAQRQYWSDTQARLLAQRIAWSHVELLVGHTDA